MGVNVAVIDYGVGNLLSVERALERCRAKAEFVDSAAGLAKATHLILPGVGAFSDGMKGIRERGLVTPIRAYVDSGRPFLGICLGMQMMLEWSEEFGEHEGLGLVSGRVIGIERTGVDGVPHKIPHIGWNGLVPPPGTIWKDTILSGVNPGNSAYFVHSFVAHPAEEGHRLADCHYNGRRISAVIRKGAAYGCQFHPEKSGEVGLKILSAFLGVEDRGDQPW